MRKIQNVQEIGKLKQQKNKNASKPSYWCVQNVFVLPTCFVFSLFFLKT